MPDPSDVSAALVFDVQRSRAQFQQKVAQLQRVIANRLNQQSSPPLEPSPQSREHSSSSRFSGVACAPPPFSQRFLPRTWEANEPVQYRLSSISPLAATSDTVQQPTMRQVTAVIDAPKRLSESSRYGLSPSPRSSSIAVGGDEPSPRPTDINPRALVGDDEAEHFEMDCRTNPRLREASAARTITPCKASDSNLSSRQVKAVAPPVQFDAPKAEHTQHPTRAGALPVRKNEAVRMEDFFPSPECSGPQPNIQQKLTFATDTSPTCVRPLLSTSTEGHGRDASRSYSAPPRRNLDDDRPRRADGRRSTSVDPHEAKRHQQIALESKALDAVLHGRQVPSQVIKGLSASWSANAKPHRLSACYVDPTASLSRQVRQERSDETSTREEFLREQQRLLTRRQQAEEKHHQRIQMLKQQQQDKKKRAALIGVVRTTVEGRAGITAHHSTAEREVSPQSVYQKILAEEPPPPLERKGTRSLSHDDTTAARLCPTKRSISAASCDSQRVQSALIADRMAELYSKSRTSRSRSPQVVPPPNAQALTNQVVPPRDSIASKLRAVPSSRQGFRIVAPTLVHSGPAVGNVSDHHNRSAVHNISNPRSAVPEKRWVSPPSEHRVSFEASTARQSTSARPSHDRGQFSSRERIDESACYPRPRRPLSVSMSPSREAPSAPSSSYLSPENLRDHNSILGGRRSHTFNECASRHATCEGSRTSTTSTVTDCHNPQHSSSAYEEQRQPANGSNWSNVLASSRPQIVKAPFAESKGRFALRQLFQVSPEKQPPQQAMMRGAIAQWPPAVDTCLDMVASGAQQGAGAVKKGDEDEAAAMMKRISEMRRLMHCSS